MDFVTINGKRFEINDAARDLLRATASNTPDAFERRMALAQVVQRAWRAGVLHEDLISGIYDRIPLPRGADAKFPFDFYSPSDEEAERFKAFVVPKEGAIPDRAVEGEEIYVPTFKIANSISWSLDYARDARWDVIARAIEVFTNGFTQSMNDDGWHVILRCAAENAVIEDAAAASGTFSKRLVTNLQTGIKRLTGGRQSRLTDIYTSPEGVADIRNFARVGGNTVDDQTLRNLITAPEEASAQLFGVRIHAVHEFGVGQEYDTFLTDTVGVSHLGDNTQFCVGLDLAHRDSFVMPVRADMEMFDDPTLHRRQRAGVYGWMEHGFACLDSRRAILGDF